MTIKSKLLGLMARADLPPRATEAASPADPAAASRARAHEPALSDTAHLGPYGALIAAVRAEPEHLIVGQLKSEERR
jgi:hypothetical protein